jgi:uncharacterized protein YabN with tetrapyrrole methylase and pyrophosphatase domain
MKTDRSTASGRSRPFCADRGGCAWDREQTSRSLRPYLIEEAYELYDAIEKGGTADIQEELGDLLYQVYAHCQIAAEEGLFTIDDVAGA